MLWSLRGFWLDSIALALLACIIIAEIADLEDRPRFLWGALTFLYSLLLAFLIPIPYFHAPLGFLLALLTMIAVKLIRND